MKASFALSVLLLSVAIAPARAGEPFHFEAVEPGLLRGSQPESPADYDQLARLGVRTVLSLEVMPREVFRDYRETEAHGMKFIHVPMLADWRPPTAVAVTRALDALSAAELKPIFVHCLHGEDRTGLLVGLYRVHYDHWTPEAAFREMLAHGFHTSWYMSGLLRYFVRDTGWVPPGAPPQLVAPAPDFAQ